jgi:hypothetical protein
MKFSNGIVLLSVFISGVSTATALVEGDSGTGHVVRIIPGSKSSGDSDSLLYFSNGQVGRLHSWQVSKMRQVRESMLSDRLIHYQLDSNQVLTQMQERDGLSTARSKEVESNFDPDPIADEEPSVIDQATATRIFADMNPYFRNRSQCYNRALVWGYEAFKKEKLNSRKVFMFFTAKYIRDYHYAWWFHSSPYALVRDQGGIEEKILDRAFMKGPVSFHEWSNHFIRPQSECLAVDRYADYSEHEYDRDCYFINVPMYYWQPKDIESRDQGKPHEASFVQSEVDYAYWQGFGSAPPF